MKYKIQTAAPFGWADLKTSCIWCGERLYLDGNLHAVCTQPRGTEHSHNDLDAQQAIDAGLARPATDPANGKTYVVEEYATKKEAWAEIYDIVLPTDGSASDYRVVTIDTPQDGDLYD